ncbi:hypothetical protein BH10PLA1_BH10PLA1_22230 [soil metagenome]
MFASKTFRVALLSLSLAAAAVGCAGRPSILPNSDESLRKTSAQFAADAVKRFPYPGGKAIATVGKADVDVMRDVVQLCNLSNEPWTDFDVWLNGGYVVHVGKIEANGGIRTLDFQMMFNDKGESFPTDNDKYPLKSVEIFRDGKLYKVQIVIN